MGLAGLAGGCGVGLAGLAGGCGVGMAGLAGGCGVGFEGVAFPVTTPLPVRFPFKSRMTSTVSVCRHWTMMSWFPASKLSTTSKHMFGG